MYHRADARYMELCTFFMSSYLRKRNRGSARFSHQLSTWSNHDPPYAKRNNSREKNYSLVQSFATLLCLTHSLTHFIIQENNYCFWVFNPQWNVCAFCLFVCLLLFLGGGGGVGGDVYQGVEKNTDLLQKWQLLISINLISINQRNEPHHEKYCAKLVLQSSFKPAGQNGRRLKTRK